ncbi:hypothetical protein P3T76_011001 [Phytophthora citrophthora]|uniref:Uncharacterized protein n=1 Tax=Phytophthora citrophthora TaxID=4793 RepID=A0AAD9GBA0_9STRA|nr:hypothetical protein P3T76_011001 [Phytophthora citrophthora]
MEALLLGTSYKAEKLELGNVMDAKVNLMDGHSGQLSEQRTFELYLDANGLRKDNKRWKCRSVMPPPQEDLLLHLTMTRVPMFNEPLCTVMSVI